MSNEQEYWTGTDGYKRRYFYRDCPQCNTPIKTQQRRTSNTVCKSCHYINISKNPIGIGHKKKEEDKIVYKNFCFDCYKQWTTRVKRKGFRCLECTRKNWSKSSKPKVEKVYKPKVRMYRICPKCTELGLETAIKEVTQKKNSGSKMCQVHKITENERKPRKKKTVIKKKTVSKEAIKEQQRINRLHKESVKAVSFEKKNETGIKAISNDEESMIKEFLKKNKPSTLFKDEEFKHVCPSSGLGSNSSVLGV